MRAGYEGRGPIDAIRRARAVAALQAILPTDAILAAEEAVAAYECDGLNLERQRPLAVVLPANEAEVCAILKTCHALSLPVVARGAGTGLSGGALPHCEGVLLSLARLDQILEIDPLACTARVQCGVRNLAISEAAAPFGLFYAPDPSSQIACTIGGNVAENAGGVQCLRYGLTVHNVLGIRGYTVTGEPVELGGAAPDAPGLDLLALAIGSEGTLLIVTEVLVRLLPRPAARCCLIASFDTVPDAARAVAELIAAGFVPSGLEMMDRAATRMVEPFVHAGYDLEAAAILLCEADGTPTEVVERCAAMAACLTASGATRVAASRDEAERQRFWAGRKNAFPAAGRVSPDYYCMDGTIPRAQLGSVLNTIAALEVKYDLRCPNVFHAGDGNLHPLILYDGSDPDQLARAEAFGDEILQACIAVGGTVTGEHGVGIEKIDQMCVQFDAPTRDAFLRVRAAFDPDGRLNPGKAIPTLRRCAEHGREHVHGGVERFAGLPRL
jgi:glycolate oxidase